MIEAFLIKDETTIRLGIFIVILSSLLLYEWYLPRRKWVLGWRRRANNLLLGGANVLLLRYLPPMAVVGVAEIVAIKGWGLLNQIDTGFWTDVVLAILLLDLIIYCQHVVFHKVPFLWCLHRVHHTDEDFDVTTALRFHPLEILLSAGIKIFFVMLLGAPVAAVILFEIILNVTSMFNHSNIRIPVTIDSILRYLVVTPDMHRVHHSVNPVETNNNYGFSIPWWDRLFGTYRAQPKAGHVGMKIGLDDWHRPYTVVLHYLLIQPFLSVRQYTNERQVRKNK